MRASAFVTGLLVMLVALTGTGRVQAQVGSPAPDTVTAPVAADSPEAGQGIRTSARRGREVTTVTVEVPVPEGATLSYRVETAAGIRLFAPARGTLAGRGEPVRLPLTFAVAPDLPAGLFEAVRVLLDRPDGETLVLPVRTWIEPRRRLTLSLAGNDFVVPSGSVADVELDVVNGGNVPDTLRLEVGLPAGWTLGEPVPGGILQPGTSMRAILRIRAPGGAADARAAVATVVLDHAGRRTPYLVRLIAVAGEGPVSGLAHVPGTIFVGSSTGSGAAPVVALTAEGAAFRGTRMTLALRSHDEPAQPVAFRRSLLGPRIHLGLESEAWWLDLGDAIGRPDPLTGAAVASRGVGGGWRGERGRVELSVERPRSPTSEVEEGHLVRGRGALSAGAGELTLYVSSVEHAPTLGEPYGIRAAATGYAIEAGAHRFRAEAGVMSVSDTAGSRAGPLVDARYQLVAESGRLGLRIRRVPATVQQTGGSGNELSLSGSYDPAERLTLSGWGYRRSAPRLGGPADGSAGVGGGVRLDLPARTELQIQGMYRRTDSGAAGSSSTRTLRTALYVPVRQATLELEADVGSTLDEHEAPFRNMRAGLRWSRGSSWGWAGTSYTDPGLAPAFAAAEASGSVQVRGARVSGGLSARLDGVPAAEAIRFWSVGDIPLTAATDLAVGLDYEPLALSQELRLSLGVSRKLRLPLPIPRQPVLEGVVFEDRNGNRTLDSEEPTRPGVVVVYGPFRARTDEAGRFAFFDGAPSQPRLESASLPLDLVLPVDVVLPTRGVVEVPLVRLGGVQVEIFLDRDGDGVRDAAEQAAGRTLVLLRDEAGRERQATADASGRIRFGGLESGRYTLSVRAPEDTTGRHARQLAIEVTPGAHQTLVVALPAHSREIRSRGGAPLRLDGPDGGRPEQEPGTPAGG